jgi:murein tripeptide amidase MpaA
MTVKTRFFPNTPTFTCLLLFCQGIGAAQAATASMGGFRTLAEIETALDWLSENFPTVVSPKFSIGQSIEGRDLWAIRLSDNPAVYEPDEPTVWFDALHHAREPMSAEAVLRFAYTLAAQYGTDAGTTRLIDSRNIILLPCVNPDGYEYNRMQYPNGGGQWRKNRRDNGDGSFGVDLNRNYSWQWGRDARLPSSPIYQGSAPFSEPETAAIRDFFAATNPHGVYLRPHVRQRMGVSVGLVFSSQRRRRGFSSLYH